MTLYKVTATITFEVTTSMHVDDSEDLEKEALSSLEFDFSKGLGEEFSNIEVSKY